MATSTGSVAIKDLPCYKSDDEYVYVDNPPLYLQSTVAEAWDFFEPTYDLLKKGYVAWGGYSSKISENAQKVPEYFTDDNKVMAAKTVAITIGGMGGYLLGMRRGGLIRRTLYSGVGMAFLAAFCYPQQTMDIGRSVARNVKLRWHEIMPPSTPSYSPSPVTSDIAKSVGMDSSNQATKIVDSNKTSK